jgi:hypothetical protein
VGVVRRRMIRHTSRSARARRYRRGLIWLAWKRNWFVRPLDVNHLPKPRSRADWVVWADEDWNSQQDATHDELVHMQMRGDETVTALLPAGDPVAQGYRPPQPSPPPSALSPAARQRRALADRVCAELVGAPVRWPYRAGALLDSIALPSRVDEIPGATQVLAEVAGVVASARQGEVAWEHGPGGDVLRVHGPTWSLVARLGPFRRPVLVFVDGVPEFGFQIDGDPDAADMISDMVIEVITTLSRYHRVAELPGAPVAPAP